MKCLIVEDSEVIIQVITQLVRKVSLESYSYGDDFTHADNVPLALIFSYAKNVHMALDLLLKYEFDYIFLDLNLSEELDGLRVLEYVREQQKNTPVFIVTGDNNINTVKQVIKLQPTDYLVKPVSKIMIARCLEKVKMAQN